MNSKISYSSLEGYLGHDKFIIEYIMKQPDRSLRLKYYNDTFIYYIVEQDIEYWRDSLSCEQIDELMKNGYIVAGYIAYTDSKILENVRFVEYIDTFIRGKDIAEHIIRNIDHDFCQTHHIDMLAKSPIRLNNIIRQDLYVLPRDPILSACLYWRKYIFDRYGYDNIHELIEDVGLYQEETDWKDMIEYWDCMEDMYYPKILYKYVEKRDKISNKEIDAIDFDDYSIGNDRLSATLCLLKNDEVVEQYWNISIDDDLVERLERVKPIDLPKSEPKQQSIVSYNNIHESVLNNGRIITLSLTQSITYDRYQELCKDIECAIYGDIKEMQYDATYRNLTFRDGRYMYIGEYLNIGYYWGDYMKQYNIAIPKQHKIDIKLGSSYSSYTMDEKIKILRVLEKYGFMEHTR